MQRSKAPAGRNAPTRPPRAALTASGSTAPVTLATVLTATLAGCSAADGAGALGALALLIAAAVGGAVGWLVCTLRQRETLHSARQQARLARSLLSGAWLTDAAHRLLAAGPAGAAGRALPETLDASSAEGGDLAQRLAAEASIDALPVRRRTDGSTWELAARPRFDASGAFAGHVGTLRRLEIDAASAAALAALADATGGVLLVLQQVPGTASWQVLAANEAARAAVGDAPTLDDARI
ncbi:MAG: hypothetical protein ABI696_15440, partial [Rubrivivax sp.]